LPEYGGWDCAAGDIIHWGKIIVSNPYSNGHLIRSADKPRIPES
jgi:hypothetical protein